MRLLLSILIIVLCIDAKCQTFDPIHPDENLLKELVLQKINAKRVRRKAGELIYNKALQETADEYITLFRYSKLENTGTNKLRIKKKIKKNAKLKGYKNAFIDFHILSINAMNYHSDNFYYDKEDTETNTHLFIGSKPSAKEKKEDSFKSFPMKALTYDELATLIARNFIRDDGYFGSLNNGYENYGFALAVDKNTILKRKIPKVKVILIMGGKRITW